MRPSTASWKPARDISNLIAGKKPSTVGTKFGPPYRIERRQVLLQTIATDRRNQIAGLNDAQRCNRRPTWCRSDQCSA
jgi:hypothetical protein